MNSLLNTRCFLLRVLVVTFCLGGFCTRLSFASSDLTFQRSVGDPSISSLTFSNDPAAELEIENVGDHSGYFAVIEGLYPRKNWTLIVGRVKVPRDADGHFKLKTELRDKQKNLTLAAIGPDGQIEFESIQIGYPSYPLEKRAVKSSFAIGAGVTHIWYTQEASTFANAVNYSEDTITVKGGYLYRLAPRWDLGLSAFLSTLTFGSSVMGTSVRSLGINARAGYNIPIGHSPWTISLMAGAYYTTMFVSPSSFGFQNLAGPQFFPVIRRTLKNQDSIGAYAKYSPVSSGSFSLQPSSREIAGGFTYSHLLNNGHSVPISLDVSNLKATAAITDLTSGSSQNVNLNLTTLSLSAGYTF